MTLKPETRIGSLHPWRVINFAFLTLTTDKLQSRNLRLLALACHAFTLVPEALGFKTEFAESGQIPDEGSIVHADPLSHGALSLRRDQRWLLSMAGTSLRGERRFREW
jgi:hypothetical protein